MKKYLLLIALLAGCNFAFTSCSDDDDNTDEIDTEAEFSEEAMAAYCALNELCDIDELPSNWQTYTAEPTYGYTVDASNPYVRTVYIDDIMEAEDCFRSLGGTIEHGQANATFTAGSISYVYTAYNQSDLFATIDCNVPQVPDLTQIRFVPSDAQEDNFSWAKDMNQDDIYYSLGDVIQYKNAFWVCVRPAIYGLKHKTYWVTICATNNVAESDLFTNCFHVIYGYEKHGAHTVPTKLGTNVTSFKHFAILLNAMSNWDRYGEKAKKYGFGVGDKMICNKHEYKIDKEYFSMLAHQWLDLFDIYNKLGLIESGLVFPDEHYTVNARKGFLIFYKGYSSWWGNMKLWALHSVYHEDGEEIDPYNDFKDLELKWEMSKIPQYEMINGQKVSREFNIKQYLHCGAYMEERSGVKKEKLPELYGLTSNKTDDQSVNYGFLVKDICFTGSPYEAIPGATDIMLVGKIVKEDDKDFLKKN